MLQFPRDTTSGLLPREAFPESRELVIDSEDAKRQPPIQEFIRLCEAARGDGTLDFEMLQQRPFMKYWKSMSILRWDDVRQDFVVVFFGTGLREDFGQDCRGTTLDFGGNPLAGFFRDAHRRTLFDRETVYFSGTLAWRDKPFIRYHAVVMPLQRNGVVAETLTWVWHK